MKAAVVLCVIALAGVAQAQTRPGNADAYEAACAGCHGSDGRGAPAAAGNYPVPVPDFSDCRFANREPDSDWLAVSHAGGPARGFDRLMPAFGEALSREALEQTLAHVRSFCRDAAWPRGELNLPRALVTTKAFPEDEAVVTLVASETAVSGRFVYEQRIGPRNQFEIIVPISATSASGQGWQGGVGDLAFAFKRALFHDFRRGSIVSAAVEAVLPTGSTERGIGSGTAVIEPFVAVGQILPRDAFLQFQAGAGLALERSHADEFFWRGVLGQSYTQGEFGRSWSPMIEVLATHERGPEPVTLWDVAPQMQVTLNTRQHIMLNAGVRVPVSRREGRSAQGMVYLLWDWFDGSLFDGW